MISQEVTDIPVWEDCPYRNCLPEGYEIRREYLLAHDAMRICIDYSHEGHVWCEFLMSPDDTFTADDILACLSNIAGIRFETEYPGKWTAMFEKQARAIAGEYKFTSEELAMIKRHDELHPFQKPFLLPGVQDTSLGSRASS